MARQREEDPDLEVSINERDSEPRARKGETVEALAKRLEHEEFELRGRRQPVLHVSDEQIEHMVARISVAVAESTATLMRSEITKQVRADVAEAFRQMGFVAGKVLS